ncbi:hypothetical protein ACFTWH_17220 [Streptomyces sp. NPDC057011]|uniref:hypothetical protein n=1 Tax=unclassified Streptomyces TaxID=2593676 RepID=UPI0036438ADE
MKRTKKLAYGVTALAMAAIGMTAGATPASAIGGPVKATLFHYEASGWYAVSTIRSGGFSSNTGALTPEGYWYRFSEKICTGSATP